MSKPLQSTATWIRCIFADHSWMKRRLRQRNFRHRKPRVTLTSVVVLMAVFIPIKYTCRRFFIGIR